MKEKYKRLYEQQNYEIKKKLIDFFSKNPSPPDEEVHNMASSLGLDPDNLETIIYQILGSFLGSGKSKDFTGTYDPQQLQMGIRVEMEHTTCPLIAERIAKDHLAEMPDYYTKLEVMENE